MELTSEQTFRALWSACQKASSSCESLASHYAHLQERVALAAKQLEQGVREKALLLVQLDALKSRLAWSPGLPVEIRQLVADQLAPYPRARSAMVCTEFRETMKTPRGAPTEFVVSSAAVGFGGTLMCTSLGVFSWDTAKQGVLGASPLSKAPLPVALSGGQERVIGVASGQHQLALCTAEGRLYTSGRGMVVPRLVDSMVGTSVAAVSMGRDHTVVLTAEGHVYTFGCNSCGQLGRGYRDEYGECARVRGLIDSKVCAVTAGFDHTVVSTAQGHVYTFGNGIGGQLGHGRYVDELAPRLVDGLVGIKVVAMAAGSVHTVVCTVHGKLYTFGTNTQGQLGHDSKRDELVPRLLTRLIHSNVTKVASGQHHTMVCTATGELHTWGSGVQGQLGHGQDVNERVPRLVESFVGRRVVGLAAGCAPVSLVWTDDGQVYSFGHRVYGKMGESRHMTCSPKAFVEGAFVDQTLDP